MRLFFIVLAASLSASTVTLAPIVVKAKKETPISAWQFIESLATDHLTTPGFEEQQLKNIPGVSTTTTGNPGQLTTIKIQGASSEYTKVLWSGLSISEMMTDAALIPFSTGKVEIVKGVHCAEYGNGAIGGVVNVNPFLMPEEQCGGVKISTGNDAQSGHLWWRQKTKDGFSLQQHIEGDAFHGKNTIPKIYRAKYSTSKSPQTQKRYFLNQFGFDSHHIKGALQVGLVKSTSTGSNIRLVRPYDSRSKRTLQIYGFELEGRHDKIQPYIKMLSTITSSQDFSPYQNTGNTRRSGSGKTKIGVKIKQDSITFEPTAEYHRNTLDHPDSKQQKNDEYAFAQGVCLNKDTFKWQNWARVQKADHYKPVCAASSSLLKAYNDTEFSIHFGTGFRLPDLYMLNSKLHGNKDLKNESAYGGNIGVAQKTKVGTFSVLVFKTEYKHQITYQNNRYINLGRARQEGFEVGWKNKLGSWGIELSGLYTDSVSLKPKRNIANVPKISVLGKVLYEHDDIAASAGWRYIGHQTQSDFENYESRIKRGGYPVFFGDFQYAFKEHARWFFCIENALARKIESPLGYRNLGFQINTGISITW